MKFYPTKYTTHAPSKKFVITTINGLVTLLNSIRTHKYNHNTISNISNNKNNDKNVEFIQKLITTQSE